MMKIISGTIALLIILGWNSCINKDDCKSTDVAVKSLETEYGCADTRYGIQIDLSQNYTIIRSQQEFESKVSGTCIPKINFSIYDLVIGKRGLSSGNASISYKLLRDCTNILKLHVTFNQNDAMNAPVVTYHALIPKLGDEETVLVVFAK